MTNMKKYNIFNFFTTFAKYLVEIFIPIFLYKNGYDIKEILVFFLACFIINLLFSFIASKIGEKITYKYGALISAFLFVLMYYYLSNDPLIIWLAILYSANNSFYYLTKHNYAEVALEKKHIGVGVGNFLIVTIIAMIPASYVGSLFIEKLPVIYSSLIILIIYLIGVIPLFFIKTEEHHHDSAIKLFKKMPFKNIVYFVLTQFKILFFLIYPLYIFINVKDNISYIGIINVIVGIASIIFIYFFAKKMDQQKSDYMFFSALFLSSILLLEINITSSLILLFTSFIEGIVSKLYDTSSSRNYYFVSDKDDKSCYFFVADFINNISKALMLLIIIIFNINLYWALILFIIGIFVSGIVKFKVPK